MLCITILFTHYHSHFLSSFSKSHSRVLLLQTCSTSEFVYDHVWFSVYVYLLDLSSTYERKHVDLIFLNLQLHPFTFKTHGVIFFLWLTKTPWIYMYIYGYTCVYTWIYTWIYIYIGSIFLIHSSVVGHLVCFHGYCKQCYDKHGCANVSIIFWLMFL
jgi:hypothetical protein